MCEMSLSLLPHQEGGFPQNLPFFPIYAFFIGEHMIFDLI